MSKDSLNFRLYLITDRKIFSNTQSFFTGIEYALMGGVNAVQLREKDLGIRELLDFAYKLRELTARYGAKLFINDRVDIALAVNADGVHLRASSMPAYAARKVAGENFLIGVSTHSLEDAIEAEQDGADFVVLGPIYETPSKLKYGKPLGIKVLREVKDRISIPVYAIGGIKANRVTEVLREGAYGIACISAILDSNDIKTDTEEFVGLLK